MKKMFNKTVGADREMPAEPFPTLLGAALATEQTLVGTIPQLIEEAHDETLKESLSHHLEETRGHVRNMEQVFECFGAQPSPGHNPVMDGLTKTHSELKSKTSEDRRDLVVATAAAATEHAEIATYEALRAMADAQGNAEAVGLIDTTLGQEKHALELAEQAAQKLSAKHATDAHA